MTNITYNLAPMPLWREVYPANDPQWAAVAGQPIVGGKIYTYYSTAHSTLKTTYSSNVGSPPPANTNPIILDSNGEATIYWAFDSDAPNDLYYIEVRDPNDVLVYARDNFDGAPLTASNNDTETVDINFVRNPQFNCWDHFPLGYITEGLTFTTGSGVANQLIDDWYYFKSASGSTDIISLYTFPSGATDVEGTPSYALQFQCTSTTGTDVNKLISQFYNNSQFLNGQEITLSFSAKASVNGAIMSARWEQDFGTGGSPSSAQTTDIGSFTLSTAWKKYSATVTLDSTTGKTIGLNRDDTSILEFEMPVNQVVTVQMTNIMVQLGNVVNAFQVDSQQHYNALLDKKYRVPTGTIQGFATTDISDYQNEGWIPLVDGNTIGSPNSGATFTNTDNFNLYVWCWNRFNNTICPVSTGRGADPRADYFANKTLTLFVTNGRFIGAAGTGSGLTARAAGTTVGGETQTIVANNLPAHVHQPPAGGALNYLSGVASGGSNSLAAGNDVQGFSTSGTNTTTNTPLDIMNPGVYFQFYIHI